MSESPQTNIQWEDKTAVVEVSGDVDLHRSLMLQETLMGLLPQNPTAIIVDLGGVDYMDSSGVASLVKLLSRTRKDSVRLTLVGLNMKVQSIFEITRLDSVFDIRSTRQEAMD